MKLEKHERKAVLNLLQKQPSRFRAEKIGAWGNGIFGLYVVLGNSVGARTEIGDVALDLGVGLTLIAVGFATHLTLRRDKLIQKLCRRLDAVDPSWTVAED